MNNTLETEVMPPKGALAVVNPSGFVNIEELFRKAVDTKSAVEVMERLAVMRRELKAEHAKEAFDRAMAEFQAACPIIRKDSKVTGTKFSYNYAPMDSIINQTKALIQEHGFSYRVTAKVEGSEVTAICKVIHSLGHFEESEFKVPIDPTAHMNAAQKFASALTFAKRYAFLNAFGIMTGDQDDDGSGSDPEHAAGQGKKTPPIQHPRNQVIATDSVGRPVVTATTQPKPAAPAQVCESRWPQTQDNLTWLLTEGLKEFGESIIMQYLQAAGIIMPNETVKDWPMRWLPACKSDFEKLKAAIISFGNGDMVIGKPYEPHELPHPDTKPSPAPGPLGVESRTVKTIAAPQGQGEKQQQEREIDPSWHNVRGVIDHISYKKGTKRNGQDWENWGIKIGDLWYGTFSRSIGQLAEAAKGCTVELYYSINDRGNTAEHIEEVVAE